MNGAQAVARTLADCGVDTCFANPGTSEMHFVAALDTVPELRGVLCLFEGVATGAADGFGRMTGHPRRRCCTWAPAWRTGWPISITPAAPAHRCSRSWATTRPITSGSTRRWNRISTPSPARFPAGSGGPPRSADAGSDTAQAVAAALRAPGQIATLILPADVTWTDGGEPGDPVPPGCRHRSRTSDLGRCGSAARRGTAEQPAHRADPARRHRTAPRRA